MLTEVDLSHHALSQKTAVLAIVDDALHDAHELVSNYPREPHVAGGGMLVVTK